MSSWNEISDSWGSLPANIYTWAVQPYAEDVGFSMATLLTRSLGTEYQREFIFDMGVSAEVNRDFTFRNSMSVSLGSSFTEMDSFIGRDSVNFSVESQFTESNVMTFPEVSSFDLAVNYLMRGGYGYNVPVDFDFVADVIAVNNIVAEYSQDFSSASEADVSNYNYMQESKLFGLSADIELEVLSWGRVKPVIGSWSSENSQEGGLVSEGSIGDGWQSIPPL